jgi:streptogramin lyase
MRKLSAIRKLTCAVALVLFAWPPVSAIAQQPSQGALVSGTAGAAISTDGERKAIIQTFHNDNLIAEYHYYLWRDGCYVHYQSNSYQAVPIDACRN